MLLNFQHIVVDQLDIFSRVGRGVAHDEIVPFTVKNGQLQLPNGENSKINGKLTVEFQKVDSCCFVLLNFC